MTEGVRKGQGAREACAGGLLKGGLVRGRRLREDPEPSGEKVSFVQQEGGRMYLQVHLGKQSLELT